MAVPTFTVAGTPQGSSGAITPGLPSGWQADDIFLLLVETDDQAVSTPTGWTLLGGPVLTGATRLQVFWRRATSSESAPSISDAGDHQYGVILGFRGCITGVSPVDVFGSGNNGTSGTASALSITTTEADTLALAIVCFSNANTVSAFTASFSEIYDGNTPAGNDGGIAVGSKAMASAGATGDCSITIDGTTPGWAAMQLNLKAAVAASTWHPSYAII